MPRYTVTLSAEERDKLKALCSKGTTPTKVFVHARALLLCDQGEFAEHKWDLKRIAQALGITDRTFNNLKVRFITQGLEATLQRKPYKRRHSKFDAAFEDKLLALYHSDLPAGASKWTGTSSGAGANSCYFQNFST